MPDSSSFVLRGGMTGRLATLALLLALGGCAPARPAGIRPVVLGEAEIEAVATLLRLEDRREFDGVRLREIAGSPVPEVRRRAALAAGRIRDPGAAPLLLPLLADPDTAVAAAAAFSLGQLGDTTAVATLAALLTVEAPRQSPTVAAEVAAALGKLRGEPARQALTALLRETPVDARGAAEPIGAALLAIWRFPRDADPEPIRRWTEAADPRLRWKAAYALVRRPDPAATEILLGLVSDPDPQTRSLAVRGLTAPLADTAGVGAAATLPVVLSALRDADYRVRMNAARSLGSYGDPAAVTALAELLGADEAHLALAAAESLERLAARAAAAAPALRTVALDALRPVALRGAALAALAQVAPREAEAVADALARDPHWRLRAAAGRAYGVIGPATRPALAALVRDPDSRVGAATLGAAVAAAGEAPEPLRPLLIESLGAADPVLRAAALGGLARLADPTTTPLLLDAYARAQRDTLDDAALAAVEALAAQQRAGVITGRSFLQRFPRSEDYLVRQRVAAAFGDAAPTAWGEPLPIETGLTPTDYQTLVREWIASPLAGGPLPRVRLETEAGAIELELFAADAPLTVRSFLTLAERGYFDGQHWPRVVPNFVIQGGDPRGDQTGGPGYAIRDEINRHRYERGTLGMALSGPDTGGSQFFITHSPQPHLDGGYTVFGRVVTGIENPERVLPDQRILSVRRLP